MPFLFYLFLFGKLTLFILIRNSNTPQNEVGGGKLVCLRFAPVRSAAIVTGGNFYSLSRFVPIKDTFNPSHEYFIPVRTIPFHPVTFKNYP